MVLQMGTRLFRCHIPVIVGGTIPSEDVTLLKKMGVKEVFLPETPLEEIVEFVRQIVVPTSSRS